jgi:hypothetical protein
MLKKIPRQVWLVNIYGYFVVAAVVVLVALVLLTQDDVSWLDVGLVVGVVAAFALVWQRLHPRLSVNVPPTGGDLLWKMGHSGHYTLLAFESEYCPMCMAVGPRVAQLETVDGLDVYRLSVNREPGRSLFRQYEGRMTPTYVLVDPHGERIQEWIVALPIERILYTVRHQHAV